MRIRWYYLVSLILFSLLHSHQSAIAQNNNASAQPFIIAVKIDSIVAKTVYLIKWVEGTEKCLDSAKLISGSCVFQGSLNSPGLHYLKFNDENESQVAIFLEGTNFSVVASKLRRGAIKISGSMVHDQYEKFLKEDNLYDDEIKKLLRSEKIAKQNKDTVQLKNIDVQFEKQDSLRGKFIENYILSHPNSFVSPYVLTSNMYRFKLGMIEKMYAEFLPAVKASDDGIQINNKINAMKRAGVGSEAPLFTEMDKDGNAISLKSYRGNYVLVDFWASWCGPCRAENPNVLRIYKKFHDKGFEVLGVSLDSKKERWLAAVEKDQLLWKQVSDLKGWACAAAKEYAVQAIPHSVLINEKGIIVAINLNSEELEKKLTEIYK